MKQKWRSALFVALGVLAVVSLAGVATQTKRLGTATANLVHSRHAATLTTGDLTKRLNVTSRELARAYGTATIIAQDLEDMQAAAQVAQPAATPSTAGYCLIGPANADVLYAISGTECSSWLYETVAGIGQLVSRTAQWNPANDTFTLLSGTIVSDQCAFTGTDGSTMAVYDDVGGSLGANLCAGARNNSVFWTPVGTVSWN